MRLSSGRGASKETIAKQYLAEIGLELGLGVATFEFKFADCIKRKFRADVSWPDKMLLLEIDGGAFVFGGHSRGSAFADDCEKHSLAAILGYTLIRVTYTMIDNGMAFKLLQMFTERKVK